MNKSEETFKIVLDYYNITDSLYSLGKNRDFFIKVSEELVRNFKLWEKDEKFKIGDAIKTDVKTSLNILNRIVLSEVITDKFYKFIKHYTNLVINWNNNISGPEDILISSRMVSRYIDYHMTSMEALKLLKDVYKKLSIYKNYNIPGVELSKHYAESSNINK